MRLTFDNFFNRIYHIKTVYFVWRMHWSRIICRTYDSFKSASLRSKVRCIINVSLQLLIQNYFLSKWKLQILKGEIYNWKYQIRNTHWKRNKKQLQSLFLYLFCVTIAIEVMRRLDKEIRNRIGNTCFLKTRFRNLILNLV